jgi:calpain family cysteine protease
MPRSPARPGIQIRAVSFDGIIRGRTAPDARVEVVNLSRIAAQRLRLDDTLVAAVADPDGGFAVCMAGRGGDLIRLRSRHPGGAVSRWVTIRLPCKGRPRRPDVALFRIGFRRRNDREFCLININGSRPVAEPGAVLLFKNMRTRLTSRMTLNALGTFAARSRLAAQGGDRLTVAILCGRQHHLGTVEVPMSHESAARRALLSRLVTGRDGALFEVRRFHGPVFVRRPATEDVIQGEVTNCHLAAAASAVAFSCADAIRRMIRCDGHGNYHVALFSYRREARRFKPVTITVTSEFPVRASGALLFGTASHPSAPAGSQRTALWWPILEKAYGELHGGYGHFRNGGAAHHALATLLGRPPRYREILTARIDALWDDTRANLAEGRPVVASTAGTTSALLYRNTHVMPDHCYAVLACTRTRAGERLVTLRNPWGEVTPPQKSRSQDGTFTMPWDRMVRLFEILSTVGER